MARIEINQMIDDPNSVLIEALKSYMKFIKITDRTVKRFAKLPKNFQLLFDALLVKTQTKWGCVLSNAKKIQKAQKSAKKTA